MITDFVRNSVYLAFTSSPVDGGPASRVLGPYGTVRFSAMGIWAYCLDGDGGPIQVATQVELSWALHGFDEPPWGDVQVISPPAGTTASDIERGTDWIKPGR